MLRGLMLTVDDAMSVMQSQVHERGCVSSRTSKPKAHGLQPWLYMRI